MAFAALLQDAEAVLREFVRLVDHVVARIVDSERTTRFHGAAGCRHRCAESRGTRRLRRHRGWRRRLAELLDTDQNTPLMEFIFYTHILQQDQNEAMFRTKKDTNLSFKTSITFRT